MRWPVMFAPIHVECPNCGEQISIDPKHFHKRPDDAEPSEMSYEAEVVCECGRFRFDVLMTFIEGEENENIELADISVGLAPVMPTNN